MEVAVDPRRPDASSADPLEPGEKAGARTVYRHMGMRYERSKFGSGVETETLCRSALA